MEARFANLKKVPDQPAVRLLAMANAKLQTPLTTPANASVSDVLEALDRQGAVVDMLRLMSVALPARERVWWACLAARDLVGEDVSPVPAPLAAAEQWVRKPSDQTRDAARTAVDLADNDDDTTLCATSVVFYDEKLGTGDLAQYAAPAGASETAAFGMNIMALGAAEDFIGRAQHLLDRAADIARGGNGSVAAPADAAALVKEETAP